MASRANDLQIGPLIECLSIRCRKEEVMACRGAAAGEKCGSDTRSRACFGKEVRLPGFIRALDGRRWYM
jgi:hypothetical protein